MAEAVDRTGGAISNEALAEPLTIPREAVRGVNLVGFLEGELGLGEVARKLGRALEQAGIPYAPISYRRTPSRQEHPLELEPAREAPYDTNIICLNADHLHAFLEDVGVEFFAGRYSIGVWFWESSVFQQANLDGLRFLDELWVASEYVRRAIVADSHVPVHVIPLPAEVPTPMAVQRADLGLQDGFMFLFLFDFVSAQRKNPWAVLDAFTRAFEPQEGPVLVMKSINGLERKPELLDELVSAAAHRPDVQIVDGYLSVAERDATIATSDCFVSLHRSEGFGLAMAEAMTHGKPVIATGYSGNLEFMDAANSYLVPYRLVPVPEDWWAYAPGAEWAEPDSDAAAALMRHVWEHPVDARHLGARAGESIVERFSLERAATFVTDRLADARTRRVVRVRASIHDARTPILEASHELAKGFGGSLAAGRGLPPTSLLRRLLRRALWPYLEEQQRFETSVVAALAALQRSVEDLEQRVVQLEGSGAQDLGEAAPRLPPVSPR